MTKNGPKQAETKRDGVINPRNYNFNQFLTRKILMLFKRYESTDVDHRTWLHVPSGTKKIDMSAYATVQSSRE